MTRATARSWFARPKGATQSTIMTGQTVAGCKVLRLSSQWSAHGSRWTCQCACGNEFDAQGTYLRKTEKAGKTAGCGCWRKRK